MPKKKLSPRKDNSDRLEKFMANQRMTNIGLAAEHNRVIEELGVLKSQDSIRGGTINQILDDCVKIHQEIEHISRIPWEDVREFVENEMHDAMERIKRLENPPGASQEVCGLNGWKEEPRVVTGGKSYVGESNPTLLRCIHCGGQAVPDADIGTAWSCDKCFQCGPAGDHNGNKWNKQNDTNRTIAFFEAYTEELNRTRRERDEAKIKLDTALNYAAGISTPETFDFSEALKRMKAGKRTSCTVWDDQLYAAFEYNGVLRIKVKKTDCYAEDQTWSDREFFAKWFEVIK